MQRTTSVSHRSPAILFFAILCFGIVSIGCGSESTGEEINKDGVDRSGWPEVIRFGIVPTEGGADTTKRFGPLEEILSKELGVKVEVVSTSSYQGVITAMANDQIEFAYYGPKSYVEAAKRADAEALLLEKSVNGEMGYYAVFLVPTDSPIKKLEDARGKRFAFTGPNSTSGWLIPSIVLRDQMGEPAETFFGEVSYSGSHGTSILQVRAKELDIVATNDIDYNRMLEKGAVQPGETRVVYQSELIPGAPVTARRELPASLKEAFTEAMLTINDMPDVMEKFQNGGYVRITDEAYDIIRAADQFAKEAEGD